MDASHSTVFTELTGQISPALGLMMMGEITTFSLRLMAAGAGNAVAEEARARAERRAVKSCIVNVVEKMITTVWWKGMRIKKSRMGRGVRLRGKSRSFYVREETPERVYHI
jgi:hypothetical protein